MREYGTYDCDCSAPFQGLGFAPGNPNADAHAPGGVATGIRIAAQVDPEPYSRMALQVVSAFTTAINTVEGWFGIGNGRREADAIGPLQRRIGDRLGEISGALATADLTHLQAMYAEVQAMEQEFVKFCNDPRFTDGRASHQALYGTDPITDPGMLHLFHDVETRAAARIVQLGGSPPSGSGLIPAPGGVMSAGFGGAAPMVLAGLAIAFFAGRRF